MNTSDQLPSSPLEIRNALQGAGVTYLGTILILALGFISKVVAVRQTSVAEFGLFTSALSILNIALGITQLGLQDGIARFVALHYGSNRPGQAIEVARRGLLIGSIASLIGMVILVIGSDTIARQVMKSPGATNTLWLLWVALPFWVFANLVAAFFQGFGHIEFRALIVDVSRLMTFILLMLVLPIFSRGQPLQLLMVSLSIGTLVSSGFMLWGILKYRPWPKAEVKNDSKELLHYSVPLLATSLVSLLVSSGNVLVLNYLTSPKEVAYYSTVLSVGQFVAVGGTVFDIVLLPIFTRMDAQGQHESIEAMYWAITRWSLLFIAPIAFALFCFSDLLLGVLFRPEYIAAAPALRLVVVAYVAHVAFGPNEAALKMLGNTVFIFGIRVGEIVCMVTLGWLLTLSMGFVGMIIGWGVGVLVYNILIWIVLFRRRVLKTFPRQVWFTYIVCAVSILIPGLLFQQPEFLPRVGLSTMLFVAMLGSVLIILARNPSAEDRLLIEFFMKRLRLVPARKTLDS